MNHFSLMILVRHVWIDEKKRLVVRITGSHQHSCIFGDVSIEDKKMQATIRQYDIFNGGEIHSLLII